MPLSGARQVDCELSCELESFGKREPQLRRCPYQTGLWTGLWHTFLIDDWCKGPAHHGWHHPGTVVLDAIKKQAEHSTSSQSVSGTPPMAPASVSASRILRWLCSGIHCGQAQEWHLIQAHCSGRNMEGYSAVCVAGMKPPEGSG